MLHLPGHLRRPRLHPVWTQLLPGLHRGLLGHEGQAGVSAVQGDVQRTPRTQDQPRIRGDGSIIGKVCL